MGSCLRKSLLPIQPPVTIAQGRLENAKTHNYMWDEFVSDILIGYHNEDVSLILTCSLILAFDDGSNLTIGQSFEFCDIITKENLNILRLKLLIYMATPYYYDDNECLQLYYGVSTCKFYCIKDIVFLNKAFY